MVKFLVIFLLPFIITKEKEFSLTDSILQWASKHNITISSKLTPEFLSVNHKKFRANSDITINETILSIPFDSIITPSKLLSLSTKKLKEIYTNKNIHMTIDNLTVVRIMSMGAKRGFIVINTNGATSNQVLVYTVDIDGSGNVTSDTFSLFLSYYLVGNSSQLTGDIITSDNWSQYISTGGDWNSTTDASTSDLYNAKDLMIKFSGQAGEISVFYGYFPNGLGNEQGSYYLIPPSTGITGGYFQYNGSSIELYNTNHSISMIYYKT